MINCTMSFYCKLNEQREPAEVKRAGGRRWGRGRHEESAKYILAVWCVGLQCQWSSLLLVVPDMLWSKAVAVLACPFGHAFWLPFGGRNTHQLRGSCYYQDKAMDCLATEDAGQHSSMVGQLYDTILQLRKCDWKTATMMHLSCIRASVIILVLSASLLKQY